MARQLVLLILDLRRASGNRQDTISVLQSKTAAPLLQLPVVQAAGRLGSSRPLQKLLVQEVESW